MGGAGQTLNRFTSFNKAAMLALFSSVSELTLGIFRKFSHFV